MKKSAAYVGLALLVLAALWGSWTYHQRQWDAQERLIRIEKELGDKP